MVRMLSWVAMVCSVSMIGAKSWGAKACAASHGLYSFFRACARLKVVTGRRLRRTMPLGCLVQGIRDNDWAPGVCTCVTPFYIFKKARVPDVISRHRCSSGKWRAFHCPVIRCAQAVGVVFPLTCSLNACGGRASYLSPGPRVTFQAEGIDSDSG